MDEMRGCGMMRFERREVYRMNEMGLTKFQKHVNIVFIRLPFFNMATEYTSAFEIWDVVVFVWVGGGFWGRRDFILVLERRVWGWNGS